MKDRENNMNVLPRKWVVVLSILSLGYMFQLMGTHTRRLSVDIAYPVEPACREPLAPTIHDSRTEVREAYEKKCKADSYNLNGIRGKNDDIPRLEVLKGEQIKYAIWTLAAPRVPEASAWTKEKVVEGFMFAPPRFDQVPFMQLEGDFVSFLNFADFAYGHYNNHNLPTIAWLREQVPETTRFILREGPLAQGSLKFLDPDFNERIVWLPVNKTVEIKGSLTVPVLLSGPMHNGQMRPMTSLRKWIHEKKGTRSKKYVVFYSRKGAAHDRILADEEKVIDIIRRAMVDYGINYELKIFSGKNANGTSVSMEDQYDLFRAAHTIIGSHGAGMLGNLAWTDPFPKSCEERTKILEFINGVDSSQVQANIPYISAFHNFRKWPLEYHVITYTAKSTSKLTYVDDWALQDALRSMWGNATVPIEQG